MTNTAITLTPATAGLAGAQTVTASAALFTAADVGRLLSLRNAANQRVAATAYSTGQVFWANYNGTSRLYRVLTPGTTAAASLAGTTPNYDLNAPHDSGDTVPDGSAILTYIGPGQQIWGWGTITAYADSTHVTVTVDPGGPFATTAATPRWRLGEFSNTRGWPRAGTFHDKRLWVAGTLTKPQTLWSSNTADFENMSPFDPDGTVLDTHAITDSLDDDEVNTIHWILSFSRGLAIGAATGEFVLAPAVTTSALSPSNAKAHREGESGTDPNLAPRRIGQAVLFHQAGAKSFRHIQYEFATDSFATEDLSKLSDHILGTGAVDVAYQKRPHGVFWMVRADGKLASLTFDAAERVRAWTWHELGGLNAKAESVCCVPTPDGTADDVYVSVARTIGGQTVRTIEWIRPPYRSDWDGINNFYFVDCGLSYSGTPVTQVIGLDHLEGQQVAIIGDGSLRQPQIVTGGKVPVTGKAASIIHAGLPYPSRIQTLPPEAGGSMGTAQGQLKAIPEVTIRLFETMGGQVTRETQAGTKTESLLYRTVTDPMSQAVPLFTGDKRVSPPSGHDREGQMTIEIGNPFPLTVLAIIYVVTTNG